MNAPIIISISIHFEDSIIAQEQEHKSAMVDACTKMKPDSFKSQLQAVLTIYYEDIKGVQGASRCHKTRIVKPQFEDQENDTGNDAGAGPGAADRESVTPVPALRVPAAAGRRLQPLHRPPALLGRQGHWVLRKGY